MDGGPTGAGVAEPTGAGRCARRVWIGRGLLGLGLVAAALLLYGPGLHGGLVWDDFGYIDVFRKFETVGFFESLQWFWAERPWYPFKTYRPVLELSYVYEWHLWGMDPVGYRVTNLILHVVSGGLLVAVARQLGVRPALAACVGLLFVVSPAHVETCSWLSCRVNLLAMVFLLAALWVALSGRTVWSAGLTFLALGSKETAVVLPPLMTLLGLLRAGAGATWGQRCRAALRSSWAHWAVFVVYLLLRRHVLGTWVGGYPWRPHPDLLSVGYLLERGQLLLVALSPVNLLRNLEGTRAVLLCLNGALCVGWLWQLRRRRGSSRGGTEQLAGVPPRAVSLCAGAWFALGWFALAQVPIYNAPFSAETLVDMRSSRLLYEPTAALLVGFGLALSALPALRHALIFCAALGVLYTIVAWNNVGPWITTERASRSLAQTAAQWGDEDFSTRWIADVPAMVDGAFLFPAEPARFLPDFHPAGVQAPRVELMRGDREWERVLRRVDAHLAADRADGFELWRMERGGGRIPAPAVVREPVPTLYPLSLAEGLTVRYARVSAFDPRLGDVLTLDTLIEARGAQRGAALVFHLLDATGERLHSYTRAAPDDGGRQPLRFHFQLREQLPAGEYRLALESPAGAEGAGASHVLARVTARR